MVETIWDSFVRELLASIPGPGFDVQIGTVHISVNMKLLQDKCVAVAIIVRKNLNHAHIQITFISFFHTSTEKSGVGFLHILP